MVCTSGSVQNAADKTAKAKEQVNELQKKLENDASAADAKFKNMINTSLIAAKVTDQRLLGENYDIKVEYVSEFSLDKIANVIKKALAEIKKTKKAESGDVAMTDDAIDGYADLIGAIADAAKSTSQAAASLSYSMNRLAKGIFAFVYATSVTLRDVDTFGEEAVTATSIFYKFYESIDDANQETAFSNAVIDSDRVIHWKALQASYIDDYAKGTLNETEYEKKDEFAEKQLAKAQKDLDAHHFNALHALVIRASGSSSKNDEIVHSAITTLVERTKRCKSIITKAQGRLSSDNV